MHNRKIIYDLIVIGAGPAGMMAAGTAASRGKKTLLLEKNSKAGEKLLISGKGRCNLTNACEDIEDFLKKFSFSGLFLRNAFSQFFNTDLMEFFKKLTLSLKVERGGRVFPQSDKALDVLKALIKFLKESGLKVLYCSQVVDLKNLEGLFSVILKDKRNYLTKKVILATGGLSYPETGSDGFGLRLAEKLGHTVVQPRPGLVGINLKDDLPKKWQGISLKNVECLIETNGRVIGKEFGEMLFTHFGVSGPIILDLSAEVYDNIKNGKAIYLSIDFKPALTRDELDKRLIREFSENPNKNLANILKRLLPSRLREGFLMAVSLDGKRRANQFTKEERIRLVNALKYFQFRVQGTRSIKEAIITRGGVATPEINPKTMESKLIPGLYFAGEIIDVDAQTGGYNMQAAFSTGYVCGAKI
jgi:hypothetical protein